MSKWKSWKKSKYKEIFTKLKNYSYLTCRIYFAIKHAARRFTDASRRTPNVSHKNAWKTAKLSIHEKMSFLKMCKIFYSALWQTSSISDTKFEWENAKVHKGQIQKAKIYRHFFNVISIIQIIYFEQDHF